MTSILDNALVGLLVLVSAGYALWALGPRILRARMLEALAAGFERSARLPGLRALGRRFRAAAAKKHAACGGCEGCEPAAPAERAAEIRIPVSKIGRRT